MRTPSQTVGPFFSIGLTARPQSELPGGTVTLTGRVLDGEGAAIPDAMVELWHPELGFGRSGTDADGRFRFLVPRSPHHLEVLVFARGLLKPLATRVYPPGSTATEDPTMLATDDDDGLRWDVHLQGKQETTYFEL